MTPIEWIKTLWPVAAVLAAFGIRVEVGQALNKQAVKSLEKDIRAAVERLSRHEDETQKYLAEIRADIKTLLSRHD